MSHMSLPRSIRGRLFVTVVVAVGLALAAMIAGFNLLLEHNLSHSADQLARARASAELALVRTHTVRANRADSARRLACAWGLVTARRSARRSLAPSRLAPPGRADDTAGRRVERTRSPPPLRTR